jgi:hypothetical protein
MRRAARKSKSNLGTGAFDSSVVEVARAYHLQIGTGHAKGYMPVEVAAFIAGARWAKQVLVGKKE